MTSVERRRAVITVADNGPGVSEDLAQTIFEPYARAHHVGTQPASVGLELSVARDHAQLMDGDIVYRRAESWAEFVVTLPSRAPCRASKWRTERARMRSSPRSTCSDVRPTVGLLAAETVEPALRPILQDWCRTLKRRRRPVRIVAQVGEGAAVPFVSGSAIVGDLNDLRFRVAFGARFVVT